MENRKIAIYWLIFVGMILGIILGFIASACGGAQFVSNWITPWGDIFIRLLELVAIPLIFISLIKGIIGIQDTTKIFSLGWRTFSLYLITTALTVVVGIAFVILIKPGEVVSAENSAAFFAEITDETSTMIHSVNELEQSSPLAPLVDIIPRNAIGSLAGDGSMLQVLVLGAFLAIAAITMKGGNIVPFRDLVHSIDDILSRCIDMIMWVAPLGTMALMATLVVDSSGDTALLGALGLYFATTLLGLVFVAFVLYPIAIKCFTSIKPSEYLKKLIPVQLMAVSTSSSAATLPTTMKVSNEQFKIPSNVTSFTLPLGVTINMDGSSVYLSVTVIFIAQIMNIDLSMLQMLTIIASSVIASIGTPGIPGGVLVTLVIVLNSVGIPSEGIALVIGLARPLDMFVTAVNVTGDVAVSAIVAENMAKKGL